ncbi:MAG TPA: InlB B-repeat-containing protein, partial [Anaerolineae bacterium]|nr:InlB B-repeat-containing protein [Anaerolineae bacterium]
GTFNGWNTLANGTGTAYAATGEVTFEMPAAAVTLYAQWVMNTYTVTYDANGATGGTVPVDGSSPHDYGATVTTAANTGTLVRAGYTLNGWNTSANGSGTARAVASEWAMPAANTILYAQWTSAATYTVVYDGNGSTGGVVPVDASSPYLFNAAVTVLPNSGALVKTGNTFFGWNGAANGSGINYDPGATFNIGAANVTLYARWQATVTGTYYVDFVGGADTNAGTSTLTAWKHCPGDANATGTAASTTLAAGNQVIFKGGVQYNGQIALMWSGTDGARIVYDGNSAGTWGTGKAIIDGQDARSHAFVTYTVRNYNTMRGFLIRNMVSHGVYVYIGTTMSGLRIQDNEIIPDGNGDGIQTIGPVQLHATGNTIHGGNVDGIKGQLANGSIIEHNTIYDFASVLNHGDGVQIHGYGASAYVIVRYNLFYNSTQNIYLNAWAGPGGSFDVYGNVVYRPNPAYGSEVPDYNGISVDPQNPASPFGTIRIYNNTLVDLNLGSGGFSGPGRIGTGGMVDTLIIKNNLFYNSITFAGTYLPYVTNFTRDYNMWTSATRAAEEAHGIYWSGSTELFTNHAARNYRLAVNPSPGVNLGSPYNVDYDGNARLNWSPGAFDYQDGVGATYSVTYDANGATSGTVPVDASSPYAETDTVTVKANTGTLAIAGHTLSSWNTAADGSGTAYAATGADTFLMGTANITLYAQWTINTHTVTYNANGADGGVVPTDASSPYNYGANVTTLGNTGGMVETNKTFGGWNTAANGSGTSRAAASTWAIGDADVILYAQWVTDSNYSVTYHGNGATGGSVPVDGSSPYWLGATVTVAANTGTLVRAGHTYNDWNTEPAGGGTPYDSTGTDSFVMGTAPVVLYAQWTVISYTVTYDENTADSGTPPTDASSPYESGAAVTTLPNSGNLVKADRVFGGWNTAANGSGTYHSPGTQWTMGAGNVTLYAQWLVPAVVNTVRNASSSLSRTITFFGSLAGILLFVLIGITRHNGVITNNILAELKRKDVNLELAANYKELEEYLDGPPKPPEISG